MCLTCDTEIKKTDSRLRKDYIDLYEIVDRINIKLCNLICGCDLEVFNFHTENKKVHILKAKFNNAFLKRDLELLKTLNKKYLESSSNLLSLLNESIENGVPCSSTSLTGTKRVGENGYLAICNIEKLEYQKQLILIENLEYYLSH
jgi:hypothetical protein